MAREAVHGCVVDDDERDVGDVVRVRSVAVREVEREAHQWNMKSEYRSTHRDQEEVVLLAAEVGRKFVLEGMGIRNPGHWTEVVVAAIETVGGITRDKIPDAEFAILTPFQEGIAEIPDIHI